MDVIIETVLRGIVQVILYTAARRFGRGLLSRLRRSGSYGIILGFDIVVQIVGDSPELRLWHGLLKDFLISMIFLSLGFYYNRMSDSIEK